MLEMPMGIAVLRAVVRVPSRAVLTVHFLRLRLRLRPYLRLRRRAECAKCQLSAQAVRPG